MWKLWGSQGDVLARFKGSYLFQDELVVDDQDAYTPRESIRRPLVGPEQGSKPQT
jgi:hypothetical protein